MKSFKSFILILLLLATTTTSKSQYKKREMRAVWIATVANIDWPSQSNLSSRDQRIEMRNILDKLAENKINTIVFQIRPTADAFYPSALDPWSQYLTGKQGKKPADFYDPLAFIIEEAHSRCMEVHVWLNPYRVSNGGGISGLSKSHIYHQNKNLVVEYGGKHYFNPGLDETRAFLNKVVEDVVERYDVDAIHFDDYFYPYPVNGESFPDIETFKKNPRGFAEIGDWRRNNVNLVISELQHTIKNIKPWIEFGISPFGVYRNIDSDPKGSDTKAGIQNYDDLYADILKWLREGTIDYVVPQLYWEIGKKVADYEVLIKWWNENSFGKNLYIGLYASALEINQTPAWKKPNELARQLRMNRDFNHVSGAMFFSAKPFLKNLQGLNDSLKNDFYKYPCIHPENTNINGNASAAPANAKIIKEKNFSFLIWDEVIAERGNEIAYYVVYAFKGKKTGDFNDPANILTLTTQDCVDLKKFDKKIKGYYTFVVTSINRFKKESLPVYAITRKM